MKKKVINKKYIKEELQYKKHSNKKEAVINDHDINRCPKEVKECADCEIIDCPLEE